MFKNKSKKILTTMLLASLVFSLVVGVFNILEVHARIIIKTPLTVGSTTATSGAAYIYAWQRKSFIANGLIWVFWCNGPNIGWSTSTNGSSWSSMTVIRTDTSGSRISVWFDGQNVSYSMTDGVSGHGLFYRKGIPNANGTITWYDVEQTAVAGVSGQTLSLPSIIEDSSGYPWICFANSTHYQNYATTSNWNNGTWGTTPSGFPKLLITTTYNVQIWSVPLLNRKVLALAVSVATGNSFNIVSYLWNGTAWGAQATVASNTNQAYSWSIISSGNTAYFGYLSVAPYSIHVLMYNLTSNFWYGDTTVISTGGLTSPCLTLDDTDNLLYVLWSGYPTTNHLYYSRFNLTSKTWDSSYTDWGNDTAIVSNIYTTSFWQANQGYIGFLYVNGVSSPWQAKIQLLISNPSYVRFYQNTGGTFLINGTSNTNGTSTQYPVGTILNLTAIPTTGFLFNKFTYGSNLNYSSTFYLTLTQNLTIWCYFKQPLSIISASTKKTHVNPSEPFYINGTIYLNGTSTAPPAGNVTIYVSCQGDIRGSTTTYPSGNYNITTTSYGYVGNWSYKIYAVNIYEQPSVANKTLHVVSDKIVVTLHTNTVAPAGGVIAKMNATAVYSFDNVNVTTLGVTISRNGSTYTHQKSWNDTESASKTYLFTASGANDTTYGLTAFSSNTLTIAWGQTVIEVSTIYQNLTRTGINQHVAFAYHVIYGGNLSNVNSGNLIINGSVLSISNGWCNFTSTYSNIGLLTYIASGSSFPNTVFSQIPSDPQVIFDEDAITLFVTSNNLYVGQSVMITWSITRIYDSSTVSSYNMSMLVNGGLVYSSITQSTGSITDSLSGSGGKIYSIGSLHDNTYGITSFSSNSQSVVWTNNPNQDYFGQNLGFQCSVTVIVTNHTIPVISATVTLGQNSAVTNMNGTAQFLVTSSNYVLQVICQGIVVYTGNVQISQSQQTIPIELSSYKTVPTNLMPPTTYPVANFGILIIAIIIICAVAYGTTKKKTTSDFWKDLMK